MLFFPDTTTSLKWQNKEDHEFSLLKDNQTFLAACQLADFSNGKLLRDKKSSNSIIGRLERLLGSAKSEDSKDSEDFQNLQNLEILKNLEDLQNSEESKNLADLVVPDDVEGLSNEENNAIELDDPDDVEGSNDEEDDTIELDDQIPCQKKRNSSKHV